MNSTRAQAKKDGLLLVAYPGGNKILLAMSLDDDLVDEVGHNLAGFAIWRQYQGKSEQILSNRIGFTQGVTKQTTSATRVWTPSDAAPFQKFRWIDVPPDGFGVSITYRVQALYFTGQGVQMKPGPAVSVTVVPARPLHSKFQASFTRGYIASQAYADKFHNADIRPKGAKTPNFDTAPFKGQYVWLGAEARQALFDFIDDCKRDADAKVDVFAYDLDEPDIVSAICAFGTQGRLRAILDDADLHSKPTKAGGVPPEIKAAQMIVAAAGKKNVKQGKFGRYQHNKVFIKRDAAGKPQRVLFGSMNFSVRGVYVQANNIIVVDDSNVAGMFATAFDVAFETDVKAPAFQKNDISKDDRVCSASDTAELPKFSLALSPHKDWTVALGPMSDRIRAAKSSVLFAVMEPTGGGPVLLSLRAIAANPTVFSYGTVETDNGLAVQSPDGAMGAITGFAALTKNVPAPFTKEFNGGSGKHIHDKFVVVDFNGDNPVVFTGSSNLASGGETQNGDSLAMIEDAAIAGMFAIEAVALFDHYHFRKAMQKATKVSPLTLWYPGKPGMLKPWWAQYYDKTRIQMRDRFLFAGLPLPAGLVATKDVDWKSLDDEAAKATKSKPKTSPPNGAAATKTSPKSSAGKTSAKKRATAAKTTPAKKRVAKSAAGKNAATGKRCPLGARQRRGPHRKPLPRGEPWRLDSRRRRRRQHLGRALQGRRFPELLSRSAPWQRRPLPNRGPRNRLR